MLFTCIFKVFVSYFFTCTIIMARVTWVLENLTLRNRYVVGMKLWKTVQ